MSFDPDVVQPRTPPKQWSVDELPGGSIDFGVAVGLTSPDDFVPGAHGAGTGLNVKHEMDEVEAVEAFIERITPVGRRSAIPVAVEPPPDSDDLAYGAPV